MSNEMKWNKNKKRLNYTICVTYNRFQNYLIGIRAMNLNDVELDSILQGSFRYCSFKESDTPRLNLTHNNVSLMD